MHTIDRSIVQICGVRDGLTQRLLADTARRDGHDHTARGACQLPKIVARLRLRRNLGVAEDERAHLRERTPLRKAPKAMRNAAVRSVLRRTFEFSASCRIWL